MAPDPVDVLDRAFAIAAQIGGAMNSALTERGLTPVRAGLLLVLHEQGRPVVQRELSQLLQCTPRYVTALVDALETQGWAERQPHPRDRRATLVALTPKGVETAEWMAEGRRKAAHRLLGDLPEADLAGFLVVADRLLGSFGPDEVRGAG
ncbi:MarR family winged helix-turn-helix transcriptional regulator [Pseudonocardia sp. TRM90224]|uniref:MarR family winged helix-turn-helix transcriptional regulator n=1 Tax=Pseudonocardia sp. TRM90224 TaxID=2812678 RepID=UPI001E5E5735|nr:MarR family transcriptional regulator [Pseudonocardia sp. TRM90224]